MLLAIANREGKILDYVYFEVRGGLKQMFDEFVKSQKPGKCHAELDSASNRIKDLRDPETSSG